MSRQPELSIAYKYNHLLWQAIDLLFPPRCAGCGSFGYRWCPQCSASVLHPAEPLCQICGVPLDRSMPLCLDCRKARPRFCELRAWSVYEPPVRTALHRLKYRRDAGLAEALAPQLA
ncbi:MAG: ComF family protein [Anaerolineae bacterium]